MSDAFHAATAVADAVLYEGYLLYPYRASSDKNRMRWQFGVLVPPDAVAATGEEAHTQTQCLCEPVPDATLQLRLRFLHIRVRTAECRDDERFRPVDRLTVDGEEHTTWDEAVEREIDAAVDVASLLAGEVVVPFFVPATEEIEPLPADGSAGRLVRRCAALHGELRLSATALTGPFGGVCLSVEVHNMTPAADREPLDAMGATHERPGVHVTSAGNGREGRDASLPRAFIGAHTLLGLSGGTFLSLIDPPEWARAATAECVNIRTWPVLVGDPGHTDTMLSAPIILYDFPSIAPESPGPLFDGTEIDEILTLRTMTLTEEEKRQARSTDERARAILDRVDTMPPELLDRLHGTVRYLRQVTGEAAAATSGAQHVADPSLPDHSLPGATAADAMTPDAMVPDAPWWDPAADASVDPETDSVLIDGLAVAKGSRVRLTPRLSGTDAQDMFLVGMLATVQAVVCDVDGSCHVAVTIDDDPAAELQHVQGRFRYFAPTEVAPVREDEMSGDQR